MASSSGTVVGYFVALSVLICGVPLIGILIRFIRRKKFAEDRSQLIEVLLSTKAREVIYQSRSFVVDNFVEESRESFAVKVSDRLTGGSRTNSTANLVSATDRYYPHALRQSHIYWGLKGILCPEGRFLGLSLPDGLVEDFVFYSFNNINPLPFVFGDEDHPETIPVRLAMYCTAQAFVLFIYVVFDSSSSLRMIIGLLLSPLILFVQYLFKYMLFCPCLENDDIFEEDVARTNLEKKKIEAGCVLIARWGGVLIALPFLLSLVFFLVILSIVMKDGHSSDVLARFLWGGIIFPFILDVLQASANYWWFVTPTHLKICGVCVMTINAWSELRMHEKILFDLKGLSNEERSQVLSQQNQSWHSPADFFHMSCYCIKYSGLAVDTHHDVAICTPSCYCGRCCDAISLLYWEEKNEFAITDISSTSYYSRSDMNDNCIHHVVNEDVPANL